jgi:hypothetical protein
MKTQRILAASLLTTMAAAAQAASTTYIFDTVTAIDMDSSRPSISGVLVNTSNVVTVDFLDNTNGSYRFVVGRCVPLFITAIEKPGRYLLRVTVDPSQPNIQLISCRLEIKS